MYWMYTLVCVTGIGKCTASYIAHLASKSSTYRAPMSSKALKLFMHIDLEREVNKTLSNLYHKQRRQSVRENEKHLRSNRLTKTDLYLQEPNWINWNWTKGKVINILQKRKETKRNKTEWNRMKLKKINILQKRNGMERIQTERKGTDRNGT